MQGSQTTNNRIESSVGIIPADAGLTKIFFNAFHVGLLRTSNSFNLCMSNRIITLTFTNRLLLNRFSLGIDFAEIDFSMFTTELDQLAKLFV